MKEKYVVKGGKELKIGYTTGSCASAASTASAMALLTGKRVDSVKITLPANVEVIFNVEDQRINGHDVSSAVRKDGGDDPDATHGMLIYSKVALRDDNEITISGGEGIGVVTSKGLQCPVGAPAINPVPQKMIRENLKRLAESLGYSGGFDVTIYAPEGEERAKKTFNGRMGIVGGISILGTTGIVDPMSEKALMDTVKAMADRQKALDPDKVLISPGNYGKDFCKNSLGLDITRAVEISNFLGESLDYLCYKEFKKVLLVGHTGKLVKIAAGVMNTHSHVADGRMEIIASHAGCLGAKPEVMEEILKCITTDQAFDLIKDEPYYQQVKARILDKVMYHLNYRVKDQMQIEVVMFSTEKTHIIMSPGAMELIEEFKR